MDGFQLQNQFDTFFEPGFGTDCIIEHGNSDKIEKYTKLFILRSNLINVKSVMFDKHYVREKKFQNKYN